MIALYRAFILILGLTALHEELVCIITIHSLRIIHILCLVHLQFIIILAILIAF